MTIRMNLISKYLLDIIFPNRCPICNNFIKWDKLCCEKCIAEIPFVNESICMECGKPNCICNKEKFYDKCIVACFYEKEIPMGIVNFKINNGINFGEYFADYLSEKIKESDLSRAIDLITCVPMTKIKVNERGYNQAKEIAEYISKNLNKKLSNKLIIKNDDKLIQHKLNSAEREKSVIGAYYPHRNAISLKGKTILLCDDVITTGSTLNEVAKQLKKLGAETVICAVIATTRLK